jgi:hypothetical protein
MIEWTPLLLLEIIAIECTKCSDGYTFLSHKKAQNFRVLNTKSCTQHHHVE